LVIFVIIKQVIPHNKKKFEQIFVIKREKVDWRKAFKREWKTFATRTLNNSAYFTDVDNWIYRCPAFFISRFLICKHLIQKKGDVNIQFFDEIHHKYPFLNMLPIQIDNFRISITSSEDFKGDDLFEDNDLQVCEELYYRKNTGNSSK
jgi:hypothetical protein